MTGKFLLTQQLKNARETFEGTVADIKAKHLHKNPGKKALPIGALCAHLIVSEDRIIHGLIQSKIPLEMGAWKGKTGISRLLPSFESKTWPEDHREWAKSVKISLPKLKSYSKAVYKATDSFVKSMKENDLEREIDMGPMGKSTLATILNGFIIGHIYGVTGEISILKGLQGEKGYPF